MEKKVKDDVIYKTLKKRSDQILDTFVKGAGKKYDVFEMEGSDEHRGKILVVDKRYIDDEGILNAIKKDERIKRYL